jgi:uncharacterized damage-inducible protein DinB
VPVTPSVWTVTAREGAVDTGEMLADAFGRVRDGVRRAVQGLDGDALTFRPQSDANSIGWLVWHLTRVQDDHVAEIAGREQTWTADGWHSAFGLPFDPADTGYGHTSEQVAEVRTGDPGMLVRYHEAVVARTLEYLKSVDADELDRVVDRSFDPPVTVGVRLVSVIGDDLQHTGQAQYVRGLYERRT